MPRLVFVAGNFFPALLIADDEPVLPAVLCDPLAALCRAEAARQVHLVRLLPNVHHQSGLMLARAGTRDVLIRLFDAAVHALQLVIVNRLLPRIAAVAADGFERDANILLARIKHFFQRQRRLLPHLANLPRHIRRHRLRFIGAGRQPLPILQKQKAVHIVLRRGCVQRRGNHHRTRRRQGGKRFQQRSHKYLLGQFFAKNCPSLLL